MKLLVISIRVWTCFRHISMKSKMKQPNRRPLDARNPNVWHFSKNVWIPDKSACLWMNEIARVIWLRIKKAVYSFQINEWMNEKTLSTRNEKSVVLSKQSAPFMCYSMCFVLILWPCEKATTNVPLRNCPYWPFAINCIARPNHQFVQTLSQNDYYHKNMPDSIKTYSTNVKKMTNVSYDFVTSGL